MRTPLSWLRDFAPFDGSPADLAATLDDLGLVVEAIEPVGEGLEQVVVARVEEIAAIDGADRIRRVIVDAGDGPVEVVCGAWNFSVGDRVPFAPVGSVLPGGFAIGRRKMKGVVSNGMLCSGRELALTDDHEGIMVLNDVAGASPGVSFTEALGIEADVVFDIAVEANRPDAWCMAGVARDLAARLRLPFAVPAVDAPAEGGPSVGELATVRVEDTELCPRFTARVLTGVRVGPSPALVARRLTLAGMRPINNVVDASNYVMLELGQPTHPYDLDRLPGGGLLVRRAEPGERVVTLDGNERRLGTPGPGLGDTGDDCLICDADGTPVGIGGVMGGESSEIGGSTQRVLLEAAYFVPMAIARTSKRLNLRTEASARFERGCDPSGIDRAVARFCEVLGTSTDAVVAPGVLDVTGDVPEPLHLSVRSDRINALLGTSFDSPEVAGLLAPLGITAEPSDGGALAVTVPTFRPDIRPGPLGEADIAEEVARTFGYSRLPRRQPAWPQPGRLTDTQRGRRHVKDVMVGLGASEAWTSSIVTAADHGALGLEGPSIEIANPLISDERFLRRSMVPGLLKALAYNLDRRQDALRLFEVGTVFPYPEDGRARVAEQELLCAVFAGSGDDARAATVAWRTLADALRIDGVSLLTPSTLGGQVGALHPTRSAWLVSVGRSRHGAPGQMVEVGAVGELDPDIVAAFGIGDPTDGSVRRVGWLQLDLGYLLDPAVVPRRDLGSRPVSRFPSSDIDLAFVVDDLVGADVVGETLSRAGGSFLESVDLFDVYRGASVGPDRRSLAYRLRFCAPDRTLTDDEIGDYRAQCIAAVAREHRAELRG